MVVDTVLTNRCVKYLISAISRPVILAISLIVIVRPPLGGGRARPGN
jgi:hypothetical protein